MPIKYYDEFTGIDWSRYSKIIGKVATVCCFTFGIIDLFLRISILAALWTIFAGYVLAVWEFPFIYVLIPKFREFQEYVMERLFVKFEETKACICLFLGLFCFTNFGFSTLAGIILLLSSAIFTFAAINRRADLADGLRRDNAAYPEAPHWTDQPTSSQSLLAASSKFGTF